MKAKEAVQLIQTMYKPNDPVFCLVLSPEDIEEHTGALLDEETLGDWEDFVVNGEHTLVGDFLLAAVEAYIPIEEAQHV
jgi:hypothetical protein